MTPDARRFSPGGRPPALLSRYRLWSDQPLTFTLTRLGRGDRARHLVRQITIVFLEALGCGLPVLAGNRDGSRDPLADGRFGLLVDPDQPLAPHLRVLLERRGPQLWFDPAGLSQAVAERFAFPAFCRRLDQLLAAEAELAAPEASR